jgi:hypothetical protein
MIQAIKGNKMNPHMMSSRQGAGDPCCGPDPFCGFNIIHISVTKSAMSLARYSHKSLIENLSRLLMPASPFKAMPLFH